VDAAGALAHLTEISSQIEAVVVADAGGKLLASTIADDARAERLSSASRALLGAAEQIRGEASAPLAQLEAATAEGSVFVVRDGERLIAATTTPEPTVGLVFYDLKSCLREIAAEEGDGKPRPKPKRASVETKADGA
jgi:predicted regulator of Ras-like GTPase activity (Roadblock/LC7/MglB family)